MAPLRRPHVLRLIPIATAQVVGVLCGVAGVILNSRYIPPETLGHYGLFLTLVPIGMWIVHAGVVKFVAREWPGSTNRPALLRRALALWARKLAWLALAALAGAIALHLWSEISVALAWMALFPAAALLVVGTIAQNALQAERSHWPDCVVSVCGSTTRTFVPLIFYLFAGASLPALWAGFGIHAAVLALAGACGLARYWRTDATAPSMPETNPSFTGPLFVVLAAAGWMLAGINRWLVALFFGENEAGFFTLAGGASVVLASTLGAIFMQFFQPGFFLLGDQSSQHEILARRVDRVAFAYTLLSLAVVGLFAAVAPWLIGPVIHERYRGALPWILPSGFFGVTTITLVFYHTLLLAGRRERACAPVELTTTSVIAAGCLASAAAGRPWFSAWLMITPIVPWVLTRPLGRHFLFKPDAT